MNSSTIKAIREKIDKANHILVIAHVNPDGDALGSLTAVGVALEQLGKQTTLVCDHGCPIRFGFLPLANAVQNTPSSRIQYDLVITVDCGDLRRVGQAYVDLPEPKPPIINIDHHVTNTRFGEINVVEGKANSTTEMLYTILPQLGARLSPDLATSLLTGIITDTLGFRTFGVNAMTFQITSDLMQAGADLPDIMNQALTLKPLTTLRLWQQGLNKMKLDKGFIWTAISHAERVATGHNGASNAGLVNMLVDVDEAIMSAVLMEGEDGQVYVGLRCRPPYSVSELAVNLGGGGHPLASGCTLHMSLAEAEAMVVAMGKDAIRQQTGAYENGEMG